MEKAAKNLSHIYTFLNAQTKQSDKVWTFAQSGHPVYVYAWAKGEDMMTVHVHT
jgi:hypothetical protein